jgi:hypothetical protein
MDMLMRILALMLVGFSGAALTACTQGQQDRPPSNPFIGRAETAAPRPSPSPNPFSGRLFAGTPGSPHCVTMSEFVLAVRHHGLKAAAAARGYPSEEALQAAITAFCGGRDRPA